jgi:thiol-disulfide isomerase/thioredoxin
MVTMSTKSTRKRRSLAVGLAALVILTAAACGKERSTGSSPANSDTSFVAGDGSIVVLDPADRIAAPAFTGTTLDGAPISSADFPGDVLVVNVWASWCGPCRAEAPTLERLAGQFDGKGVQFIGLNTRDSDTSARSFVSNFAITYPNIIDRDGLLQLGFRDSLPPQAIPSTLVIDPEGRVAARVLGEVSESSLRGVIETVNDESAS